VGQVDSGIRIDASSQPVLGMFSDADPLRRGFNTFVCNRVYDICGSNTGIVLAQQLVGKRATQSCRFL